MIKIKEFMIARQSSKLSLVNESPHFLFQVVIIKNLLNHILEIHFWGSTLMRVTSTFQLLTAYSDFINISLTLFLKFVLSYFLAQNLNAIIRESEFILVLFAFRAILRPIFSKLIHSSWKLINLLN